MLKMFRQVFLHGLPFCIVCHLLLYASVEATRLTQHEVKGMTGQTLLLDCPTLGQQQDNTNWFKGS